MRRKHKVGEEKRVAINEKLKEAGFIIEIKYAVWVPNVVIVQKSSNKWRMCVYFTNLNMVFPKNPYPLPNIYRLIDRFLGYKTTSFRDAYSNYNYIKWIPYKLFKINQSIIISDNY